MPAERLEADPAFLADLIASIDLGQGFVHISLAQDPIATALAVPAEALTPDLLDFAQPFSLRRRGIETRIIAGESLPAPDPILIRALAEARVWVKALRDGTSLAEIAKAKGCSEPYVRNRIPLAFLAPRLQALILEGRQPPDLSLARLLRDGIPMDWEEQARSFGIA
ncbi:hypothetical protein [Neogemmobacter tilapiae]|uniref:Uncharacterized protein n=1 Tax=Neogemmobacter tilapiae TaxID=875041 RepID=A0A918TXB7_9RHOB|nr:hypothetical protein [Gemmobacter tilapiae]GHC66420.1 hypothetical protein GCM10007315_33940 [Gemmobacter tilapiae]